MNVDHERFDDALVRVERAVCDVYLGSSGLFADLWSQAEDRSLFGAFGPAKRGWEQLEPVFPWVARRYRDGQVSVEYVTIAEGDDTAYTVGYERAVVSIDGGDRAPSTIRVTHVFRRENGRWMLVHRHGDFAVTDSTEPQCPPS